ncbi:MAG: hypothetical protein R3E48_20495 [Burkholderiaceae bacterium]
MAILAPHLPATQVALWGAQLAGAALPLNYLLDAAHLAQLIRAAGARVVVALSRRPACRSTRRSWPPSSARERSRLERGRRTPRVASAVDRPQRARAQAR